MDDKNMLIVTTINDLSIPLFLAATHPIAMDFLFFHQREEDFVQKLRKQYDYIYIRDPFNEPIALDEMNRKARIVLEHAGDSVMIDNIGSVDDLYYEDKWMQYQMHGKYMPPTQLLTEQSGLLADRYIIKKRLSSRARGIVFDIDSMTLGERASGDYIIQPQLSGVKEYRIYIINKHVIPIAGVKSIKTATQKVKVVGVETLPEQAMDLAQRIAAEITHDFVGLDMMLTASGEYLLIEVNRSCLFGAYFRQTGTNLADVFLDSVVSS